MPRASFLSAETDPVLRVSAGILLDAESRILIAERKGDRAFTDLWEFPGGKIAADETAEEALHRELVEELGIDASSIRHFQRIEHSYPDRRVCIDFFLVDAWEGVPRGLLGQALEWCRPGEIDANRLLPADTPVLQALKAHIEQANAN